MKFVADLHLHSKYSRACSKQLDIANLEKWAKIKGLNLLGTSDFTHPKWIEELKENLTEDGSGILKSAGGMNFVLQTEISLIYTDMGKGRRVHNLILAPNFEVVDQITEYFLSKGRIDYDGRPIFKIPCHDLVYDMRKISENIEVIPAHVWTPWFGLFGSMGGFDRIEDAFKDQTKYIHALETGLSSDPPMNWRLSALDKYSLISNSDSHSFWPWRIGREATIFDFESLSYKNILKALKEKEGLVGTIEVDPGYGKYHLDGHRNCNVALEPSESRKLKNICPACGKPLTIGVLHRVEELADREEGYVPKDAKEFRTLMPLSEILSKLIGKGIATKTVWKEFNILMDKFGTELNILLEAKQEELNKVTNEKIVEMILKNRKGEITVDPGFDGEYGIPIFKEEDRRKVMTEIKQKQTGLTEFIPLMENTKR